MLGIKNIEFFRGTNFNMVRFWRYRKCRLEYDVFFRYSL